jgi:hypothetical protein
MNRGRENPATLERAVTVAQHYTSGVSANVAAPVTTRHARTTMRDDKKDDDNDNESAAEKQERLEELGEYIQSVMLETMNFLHSKMMSDKGSADPYVGAHISALTTIYLLHLATKDEESHSKFINQMKQALKEIANEEESDGPDGSKDDVLAIRDGLFVTLAQSSTVH